MSLPTQGETFAKLIEYLRKAQEEAATMSHLLNAAGNNRDKLLAKGWLVISEGLKAMQFKVTQLAQGRMQ